MTETYRSVLALSGALTAIGGFLFFFLKLLVDKEDKKTRAEDEKKKAPISENLTEVRVEDDEGQTPVNDGSLVDESVPMTSNGHVDEPVIPESVG